MRKKRSTVFSDAMPQKDQYPPGQHKKKRDQAEHEKGLGIQPGSDLRSGFTMKQQNALYESDKSENQNRLRGKSLCLPCRHEQAATETQRQR